MKYAIVSTFILGSIVIPAPAHAQFSSFSSGSDNCSGVCVKLDLGSANNDNSFNSGFNNSSTTGSNNLRWQLGLTWKPNPPEIDRIEADRTKQRLEDNRSLMISLAEAIAQNKTELARGLAILLAPRLGYSNPLILLAEMKQGSTNIGSAPTAIPKPAINVISPINQNQAETTNINQPIIELR
jgi:hypothetical protein